MLSNRTMSRPPLDHKVFPAKWIVVCLKPRGIHQDAQHLDVPRRRPTGKGVKRSEHQQTADQRCEEIKSGCSHDGREEKQPPFRAPYSEWSVDRFRDTVKGRFV